MQVRLETTRRTEAIGVIRDFINKTRQTPYVYARPRYRKDKNMYIITLLISNEEVVTDYNKVFTPSPSPTPYRDYEGTLLSSLSQFYLNEIILWLKRGYVEVTEKEEKEKMEKEVEKVGATEIDEVINFYFRMFYYARCKVLKRTTIKTIPVITRREIGDKLLSLLIEDRNARLMLMFMPRDGLLTSAYLSSIVGLTTHNESEKLVSILAAHGIVEIVARSTVKGSTVFKVKDNTKLEKLKILAHGIEAYLTGRIDLIGEKIPETPIEYAKMYRVSRINNLVISVP